MNFYQIPSRNFNPLKNTGFVGKACFPYMACTSNAIFKNSLKLALNPFDHMDFVGGAYFLSMAYILKS